MTSAPTKATLSDRPSSPMNSRKSATACSGAMMAPVPLVFLPEVSRVGT